MFICSFSVNLTAIQYKIPEDEELDKSDVIINIMPDLRINFQIKDIHFHPERQIRGDYWLVQKMLRHPITTWHAFC